MFKYTPLLFTRVTCDLPFCLFFSRGWSWHFLWSYIFWPLVIFPLVLLLTICKMWLLVFRCWQRFWWVRLKGGFGVRGGLWWPKVRQWVGAEPVGRGFFRVTPRIHRIYSRIDRRSFEHWTFEHGPLVLWLPKLWAFHWWTLEWWHHPHRMMVLWLYLHTVIA